MDVNFIEELILQGADPHLNNDNSLLLSLVSGRAHTYKNTLLIIELLVKHGININQTDILGDTMLHKAEYRWPREEETSNLVRFLISHNADISLKNKNNLLHTK